MHLAAESHVDRSIDGPGAFVATNVVGTCVMLEAALAYWRGLPAERRDRVPLRPRLDRRGLRLAGPARAGSPRRSRYDPNSPYAASKAAADHFARAWHRTYGLPVIVTNCSNNYGPYQFPEKLIPLTIIKALGGRAAAGLRHRRERARLDLRRGPRQRDRGGARPAAGWARATISAAPASGGTSRWCARSAPRSTPRAIPAARPRERLITFVADRPGHDARYAIDDGKARAELGWAPRRGFEAGLADTVRWYLDNRAWWEAIRAGRYAGDRLGLGAAAARRPAPAGIARAG